MDQRFLFFDPSMTLFECRSRILYRIGSRYIFPDESVILSSNSSKTPSLRHSSKNRSLPCSEALSMMLIVTGIPSCFKSLRSNNENFRPSIIRSARHTFPSGLLTIFSFYYKRILETIRALRYMDSGDYCTLRR